MYIFTIAYISSLHSNKLNKICNDIHNHQKMDAIEPCCYYCSSKVFVIEERFKVLSRGMHAKWIENVCPFIVTIQCVPGWVEWTVLQTYSKDVSAFRGNSLLATTPLNNVLVLLSLVSKFFIFSVFSSKHVTAARSSCRVTQ